MRNIDPRSRAWLESVGIVSLQQVAYPGVVESYRRVKNAYPEKVSLNLLYGSQAALLGISWNELLQDIKSELKNQVES